MCPAYERLCTRTRFETEAQGNKRNVYNIQCTYESKHENDRPHHSRNTISFGCFCFLCFRINTGKNCWNEANKKADNYSDTTEQL